MTQGKEVMSRAMLELLREEITLMRRLIKVKQRLLIVGSRKHAARGPRKRVLTKIPGEKWSGP